MDIRDSDVESRGAGVVHEGSEQGLRSGKYLQRGAHGRNREEDGDSRVK